MRDRNAREGLDRLTRDKARTLYKVRTVPDAGEGEEGDFVFDEVTSRLYVKANGAWEGIPTQVSSGWAITNVTTDRAYNADSTTVAELADVLGTLIADLKTVGLLGD